ncbi:MerR family transcriptional regulator [Streptomyces chryseus]|uniref:MerR family transcriptional regulator n=1 Tax=Streptomyces chryseus TaxID=68186 RepID=UPI003570D168
MARRLRVAPTTVRSGDRRYGLGPDAQTGGRRRRWTAGDVARLERMCALTAAGLPPAEAAPPGARRGGPGCASAAGGHRSGLAADGPTRRRSRAGGRAPGVQGRRSCGQWGGVVLGGSRSF